MARGYTPAEHEVGWGLLLALLGYTPSAAVEDKAPTPQELAIAELDQWDGPHFSLARAALDRLHPEQGA